MLNTNTPSTKINSECIGNFIFCDDPSICRRYLIITCFNIYRTLAETNRRYATVHMLSVFTVMTQIYLRTKLKFSHNITLLNRRFTNLIYFFYSSPTRFFSSFPHLIFFDKHSDRVAVTISKYVNQCYFRLYMTTSQICRADDVEFIDWTKDKKNFSDILTI